MKKGDVLGVARIAGIMASKRCADLIPLCHPIAITGVTVDVDLIPPKEHGEETSHSELVERRDRTMGLRAANTLRGLGDGDSRAADRAHGARQIHSAQSVGSIDVRRNNALGDVGLQNSHGEIVYAEGASVDAGVGVVTDRRDAESRLGTTRHGEVGASLVCSDTGSTAGVQGIAPHENSAVDLRSPAGVVFSTIGSRGRDSRNNGEAAGQIIGVERSSGVVADTVVALGNSAPKDASRHKTTNLSASNSRSLSSWHSVAVEKSREVTSKVSKRRKLHLVNIIKKASLPLAVRPCRSVERRKVVNVCSRSNRASVDESSWSHWLPVRLISKKGILRVDKSRSALRSHRLSAVTTAFKVDKSNALGSSANHVHGVSQRRPDGEAVGIELVVLVRVATRSDVCSTVVSARRSTTPTLPDRTLATSGLGFDPSAKMAPVPTDRVYAISGELKHETGKAPDTCETRVDQDLLDNSPDNASEIPEFNANLPESDLDERPCVDSIVVRPVVGVERGRLHLLRSPGNCGGESDGDYLDKAKDGYKRPVNGVGKTDGDSLNKAEEGCKRPVNADKNGNNDLACSGANAADRDVRKVVGASCKPQSPNNSTLFTPANIASINSGNAVLEEPVKRSGSLDDTVGGDVVNSQCKTLNVEGDHQHTQERVVEDLSPASPVRGARFVRAEEDEHHLGSVEGVSKAAPAMRDYGRIEIVATVTCDGKTGVEMEALTAATVAALTAYDMCKAVDKGMAMSGVRVVEKLGGKSGDWRVDA